MSETKQHPYLGLPDHQFWKREPGIRDHAQFDPVTNPSFSITQDEPVVTAGSCFAQHVARALSDAGFKHLVTETAHPIFPPAAAAANGYGMFSARYGNLYTARQLHQLLLRAFEVMEPVEVAWTAPSRWPSRVVDPFRPQVQPGGFGSKAELLADRAQHFAAIRRAVKTMKVFVYTLGLTETFEDKRDGAVFPLGPGVAGGTWDPVVYGFRNFGVEETTADLSAALEFIRSKNPDVKIILTVSPVPLNATYCDRHVAVSTAWSKAVLRVAAENAVATFDRCDYFPSYEVITSSPTAGHYFAEDRREVTAPGVRHVMRLFLWHYGQAAQPLPAPSEPSPRTPSERQIERMEAMMRVFCDEEAIKNT